MVETGLVAAREQELPYEEALLLALRGRLAHLRHDVKDADAALAQAGSILARLGVRRLSPAPRDGDAAGSGQPPIRRASP